MGLKVARKTISQKICLAKIPMKVISRKGKGLKWVHCQQKCTQYVYRPVYICIIKQKNKFHYVLSPRTSSLKK